jgi:hypothetical protein
LGEEEGAAQLREGGDVPADEVGARLGHEDGDGRAGAAMDEIDEASAGRCDDGLGLGEEGDLLEEGEVFQVDEREPERGEAGGEGVLVDDAAAARWAGGRRRGTGR